MKNTLFLLAGLCVFLASCKREVSTETTTPLSTTQTLSKLNGVLSAIATNYVPITDTIQAENFVSQSGIIAETTSDAGGGQDVGHIEVGDMMSYNVNVSAAGTYTVSFRVSSINTSGAFQVLNGSTVLATVAVPNTGNYQKFTTVTANVTLPGGNLALEILSTGLNWNFNWMLFKPASATSVYAVIPAVIQGESYVAQSGVIPETTLDSAGGQDVGHIDAGDWMNYNINVPSAGSYTVNFRVSALSTGGSFQLKNGTTVLTSISVPSTGNYQKYTTVAATVTLPAGNLTLQVVATGTGWNLNWMQFQTATASATSAYPSIPGTIQAESYSAQSGVLTETTSDAGGGKDVGWIDAGDWMDYTINVPTAGSYTVGFRVASPIGTGSLQLKNGSTILATVKIPSTGGYQSWSTVSSTVTLNAGVQTLRVAVVAAGWNFNLMQFAAVSSSLVVYNQTDFENQAELSAWVREAAYASSITLSDSVARGGKYSGRFEVNLSDPQVSGSWRSELSLSCPTQNDLWYSFSEYLPSHGFQSDPNGEMIAQWHAYPDSSEPWMAPPLSLRTMSGRYNITVMADTPRISNGVTYSTSKTIDLGPVVNDVWVDWVWHIKWGYDGSGVVQVWQNGGSVLNYYGPVGFNDQKYPYFKIGIYKYSWKGATTIQIQKRILFADNVKESNQQ